MRKLPLLALALSMVATGCEGGDSSRTNAEVPQRESEARAYARQVKADLDVTTVENLIVQMPEDVPPEIRRNGFDRFYTWTFSDGSRIVAVFRPRGGEGSMQGLVLYRVDIA